MGKRERKRERNAPSGRGALADLWARHGGLAVAAVVVVAAGYLLCGGGGGPGADGDIGAASPPGMLTQRRGQRGRAARPPWPRGSIGFPPASR
jgi:hypothetical protein